MSLFRLVPALLLFLLLGGQVTLLPGQAYAYCCGCTCMAACTCAGSTDPDSGEPCYYCRSADPILQTNASIDMSAAQLQPVNESVPSSVAKSDVTGQVMELMSGGKCLRAKVALSLLGNARDGLMYVPVRFKEKNTLAFLD